MRNLIILILLGLSSVCKVYCSTDSTQVLFIGNSITYFNDMPTMFKNIANNKGEAVAVSMYAPGGAGIVNHFADPNVYSLFRNNIWDVVVIQPGSSESAGISFPVDTTVKRAKKMLDSIYFYSPCAQVYLYEIPYGVPSATGYGIYFYRQAMYKDSVQKMTDSLRVQMIPAGECARDYYARYPNLLLHNSYNDIHPSPYGSYLTACAFYAGIFQDSVSGCTSYSGIVPDTALRFFPLVDSVVLNRLTEWRINTYNLHSDFTFSVIPDSVIFTCKSSNYTNVLWDFGDGNTSGILNPHHYYATSGTYNVKLYSFQDDCADSITKQISVINTVSIKPDHKTAEVTIFPNPASVSVTVIQQYSQNTDYKIFNQSGTIVLSGLLTNGSNKIDILSLPAGIYILYVYDKNKQVGKAKFIKAD